MTLYIIPISTKSFDDVDSLARFVAAEKLALGEYLIVRGTASRPRMTLQLDPVEPAKVAKPPASKPVPAPDAAHMATVTAFFAPGLEASKAKCRDATGLAVDTIDACVAYLLEAGKLARVSPKVYRAVAA